MSQPISSYFELFRQQARSSPGAPALAQQDRLWTYGELLDRAIDFSGHFRSIRVPNIGFVCDRSMEMVAAMLGVWCAGKTFIHIDPTYPPEYNRVVLKEANIECVIADSSNALAASELSDFVIPIDDRGTLSVPKNSPTHEGSNESLAYVIFTSGSTGQPKGVTIPHRSLIHFCDIAARTLGVLPNDVQLFSAPPTYALSIRQVFVPLSVGASVHIASREDVSDPLKFFSLLRTKHITLIDYVPSYWLACIEWLESQPKEHLSAIAPKSLRQIVSVGEPLRTEIPERWRAIFGAHTSLVNIYGQTETTGVVSHYTVPEVTLQNTTVCPIGTPAFDTSIYILNDRLEPVPHGEVGELYVESPCLSSGYLNQGSLTDTKFVPNSFGIGLSEKLYKTGDLGKRLPDGTIVHLGRKDQQVKIRGMRVELGEIERGLESLRGIKRAQVLYHDGAHLIAFLIASANTQPLAAWEIKRELRKRLPHQMIPTEFIFIDEVPLTAHGKVNREALLELRKAATTKTPESMVYSEWWEPIACEEPRSIEETAWLVIPDSGGKYKAITAAMESRGISTSVISPWEVGEMDSGERSPRDGEPAGSLAGHFTQLLNRGISACSILHCASIADPHRDRSSESLIKESYDSFHDVIDTARRSGIRLTRMVYLTHGIAAIDKQDRVIPEKYMVYGVGRTARLELSPCLFTAIDIGDNSTDSPGRLVLRAIFGETAMKEDTLAIRHGRTFARRYKIDDRAASRTRRFRDGGTYLFTGGTGDLALGVCDHLSKHINARFLLLSRKGIDGKENGNDEERLKLETVRRIRSRASSVELLTADVADADQLSGVLAPFLRTGITGIIHAAGERGTFRPLKEGLNGSMNAVFRSKTIGSLNLIDVAREGQSEFVMLFSSISSILGRIGFCQYCSANAFLDGLAHSNLFPCPVLSINWDSWHGTGMQKTFVQEFGFRDDHEYPNRLTLDEGLAVFDVIANRPPGQYVVSKEDLSDRLTVSREALPRIEVADVESGLPGVSEEMEMRRLVRSIWTSVLRNSEFTDDESFFDVGGDSLSAVVLVAKIEEQTRKNIPLSQFFMRPTIARLAELVVAGMPEQHAPDVHVINAGGSNPPLLLWNANTSMPLVAMFDAQQPLILLQPFTPQKLAIPEASVETIVASMIESILPFIKSKSCYVGGYSLGGIVAYEAARQLTEKGCSVPAVLMIDSSAYFSPSYRSEVSRFLIWQLRLRGFIKWLLHQIAVLKRIPIGGKLSYCVDFFAERLEILAHNRIFALRGESGRKIVADFRMPSSALNIILYKATEVFDYRLMENDYGWKRLTTGSVILKTIGGSHGLPRVRTPLIHRNKGILDRPFVERLAADMQQVIETDINA